jgi:hypothetical protein
MAKEFPIPGIVALLIALQFAAFGWRINREITVGDKGEKTWLPVTDIVNICCMLLTLTFCILTPLVVGRFTPLSVAMLGFSFTLIFSHPINMLAHYELLKGPGRRKYAKTTSSGKAIDFDLLPYWPLQERVSVSVSLIAAGIIAIFLYRL